jgi:predicted Holliday junction resolvase-like endonuclease
MEYFIGPLVCLCIVLAIELYRTKKASKNILSTSVQNETLKQELKTQQTQLLQVQEDLGQEREKNRTLLSQKKSSETRLGQISEHLVPFLENCTHEPKNMHFMGNPIDYCIFDFDQGAITFLEVKSGNSKPTKRQKIVKNIIKAGRVFYEEIRINEKGVKNRVIGLDGKLLQTVKDSGIMSGLSGDDDGED